MSIETRVYQWPHQWDKERTEILPEINRKWKDGSNHLVPVLWT